MITVRAVAEVLFRYWHNHFQDRTKPRPLAASMVAKLQHQIPKLRFADPIFALFGCGPLRQMC
jgi:hypothetical protein